MRRRRRYIKLIYLCPGVDWDCLRQWSRGKGREMCWLAPTSNACQDAMDVVVRELGGAGGGARVIELASKSDAASPGFTWHSCDTAKYAPNTFHSP